MTQTVKLRQHPDVPGWLAMEGTHWNLVKGFADRFEGPRLDTTEWFGFIYKVTFLLSGEKYVGKKSFHRTTRTGRIVGPSNWRKYGTSCDKIHDILTHYGHHVLAWEIVMLCPTRAMMSHAESNIIQKADAITAVDEHGYPLYYNKRCEAVKWVTPKYPHRFVNRLVRERIMNNTWYDE
jgi:hypothetical protein